MVNRRLEVSIYIDQSWSMLIDLDHMMHENNRLFNENWHLEVSINHWLTSINFD